MQKQKWGLVADKPVDLFTLGDPQQFYVEITNYGAALVSAVMPDRSGKLGDVVLGYASLAGYQNCTQSLGVIVGRHANRLAKARFCLNGQEYTLAKNDGENHLHGGPQGFGKVVWDAECVPGRSGEALQLSYFSPDGEEGYPGNLQVKVVYDLTSQGELWLDYWALSDQDTVVNLTNHAYFNLQGQGSILDHELQIYSDFYTPLDLESLPTGEIWRVQGSPFDFRELTPIGLRITADHEQINYAQGYDHNWVLRSQEKIKQAARLVDQASGRVLEVLTTKPGIQFYSGNYLDNVRGKAGANYSKQSGLCLETQFFPNNLQYAHFPQAVLRAGEVYAHSTCYRFSVLA